MEWVLKARLHHGAIHACNEMTPAPHTFIQTIKQQESSHGKADCCFRSKERLGIVVGLFDPNICCDSSVYVGPYYSCMHLACCIDMINLILQLAKLIHCGENFASSKKANSESV